ncbi:MAG TPA: glycosyltransferase family 1 protein [Solirubrobacteraceae bacterium]|nr:glycosyltransferase family 1 protein [Solirubrobacteraceae bacterium]
MSPLRVGLELTVLELDRGGIARSVRRLTTGLAARDDVELVTFAQRGVLRGRVARGLARELAWLPRELPRRARRAGIDVLHCPSPLVPARPIATPLVVTVHDVVAWEHPEWMGRANVLQHRLVLERVLPRAAVVLTSSQFTRGELMRRLGLDPERVAVAPLGVDGAFTPEGDGGVDGVDGPYLLAVGTLQPRKDLATALAAFERLAAHGLAHALVVAGARGWRDAETLARVQASPHADRIHVLGRVDEPALVRALRGADVLLFPSRYEGFGLPPLEAMACGTPVIAARATSIPEVVGDAALLVEPGDVAGFAGAVTRLVDDPALRRDLRERGLRRAAQFGWDRHVDLTVAAYARAAGG